jgi:hypothetical protein
MMDGVKTARRRPQAPVLAVVGVVALQVAVPLVALYLQDPPARFAFTMYSAQGQVDVLIEDADGRALAFDSDSTIAGFRPELNWVDHLPQHLCQVVAGAHVVTVSQKGRERRLTCD